MEYSKKNASVFLILSLSYYDIQIKIHIDVPLEL